MARSVAGTITARRLVTGVGVIEYAVVRVGEDGRIAEIFSDTSTAMPTGEETLCSAFLDVHTHGAAGHDVMEATPEAVGAIGRFFAGRGVGSYLATTVTASLDATLRALEGLATEVERAAGEAARSGEARPLGIHLEGPFVSHAKRGVHPPEFLLEPTVGLLERMWEASRGTIRLMTIAPELPGALAVIGWAVELGVRVSLGHTNATAAEARAGVRVGAVSATHTFNAMRALDHREPGALGVVLDDAAMYAELICDGVHVAPEMVRMWLRMKGEERTILVTDSMAAAGMPDGVYRLGGFAVEVKGGVCLADGVLAGSVLTMDAAVRKVREFTGCALEVAVRMASANPARMLGMGMGEVRVGEWADLNRFDADGRLVGTYLRGEAVEGRAVGA